MGCSPTFLQTRIIDLYSAADSFGLSLFKFFRWPVGSVKQFFSAKVLFQPFKVIQSHWFWYQSKAGIQLPISLSE